MEETKHFIGNQWVVAASHDTIPVIDPSDGQVFAQLGRGNAADIDRAVQAACRAYEGPWGQASAADHGRVLYRLSMIIAAHQDELAHLEARDTGKPLKTNACGRGRHRPLFRVLRGRRRQAPRRNAALSIRLYRPHHPRTAWRNWAYRAVELPAANLRA